MQQSLAKLSYAVICFAGEIPGTVMRFAFKLHHATPPFVEICLETWRQDVHGGAPIISLQLMTSAEIRRSCANLRAQIDRVEQEAIAALVAKKK